MTSDETLGGSRPETARVPARAVFASIVGLWLCYFILNTIRAEMLDLGFSQELLWRRGLTSLMGVGITGLLWIMLRLFDRRPLWAKIAAALVLAMPTAVLLTQANALAFSDIMDQVNQRKAAEQGLDLSRDENGDLVVSLPPRSGAFVTAMPEETGGEPIVVLRQSENERSRLRIAEESFGRYFMMLTWCALYIAMLVGQKARTAERREAQAREAARAAELRSLRYQVNPHFLFNTFNSLSAMVLTDRAKEAEKMIQTISRFYRRSLADDPTADVTVAEEFDLQRLYLDIEAVRFPKRLRAVFDLPEDLVEARMPGMLLQPIVENSVKHAVAPVKREVTITLSAHAEGDRLVIVVADDGGVSEGPGKTRPGFGIGLANVRDRLQASFGDAAQIASGPSVEGFATRITIPLTGVRPKAEPRVVAA
ncbi:sensor histidine kinase [Paraurantiacibacter namhicola]|nr:histidine kinase [Paraurantiacibacter namhicola]